MSDVNRQYQHIGHSNPVNLFNIRYIRFELPEMTVSLPCLALETLPARFSSAAHLFRSKGKTV